ncbi:MAG: MFS transporter [Planctomycetia bacterium]|nr:MFS transporter [Planctomycetia bacterium]
MSGAGGPGMAEGQPKPGEPLPPTIRALGWTSFLTDLSSEAIYPLLPAFLLRELGGSALSVGLVDGVANCVAAIVRLPSGAASDWLGRRPLVLFGYGISAVIRPLMGLVASPLGALLVRAGDRFGKGIRSAPRDALVADLVEPGIRGRAFGHIRAMDHAGAAFGPLLAMLFLLLFPGRERTLFLLAILPGLVTLVVIWRYVRDAPARTPVAARTALAPRLGRRQMTLLAAVAIWAVGASSEQFLLLRAAELGVPAALVPLVWLCMSLAKSGSATYAGRLADRWHPRAALATGWLAFAVAYAGLAVSSQLAAALPLLLLVGVAYGIAEPAERALVARLAPEGRHGSAFGWYALVQGIMALPAGLLAGGLWQQGPQGPAWALGTTALLSTLACGLLVACGREEAHSPGITVRQGGAA